MSGGHSEWGIDKRKTMAAHTTACPTTAELTGVPDDAGRNNKTTITPRTSVIRR
jgi:hypothetical protein